VAHDLRLAEPRKTYDALPLEAAEAVLTRRRLGQVDTAMPRGILLEDQPLFDLQPTIPGNGLERQRSTGIVSADGPAPVIHDSTSRKPASSRSMSSVVAISVAATSKRSASAPLSG
jgi:hypothetical protein